MDNETITTEEVVQEVEQAPVDYDTVFMELAANGDFDKFAELEEELAKNESVPTQTEGEGTVAIEQPAVESASDKPEVVEEPVEVKDETKEPEKPVQDAQASLELLRQQLAARDEQIRTMQRQPVPAQQQVPVETQAPPTSTGSIELPDLPVRPEGVSFDPADWGKEEVNSMSEYYQKMEEYNIAQSQALKTLVQGETSYTGRLEQVEQRLRAEQEAVEQERATMQFWDSIRKFQGSSKEFNTQRDIADIHNDLETLGDKLARAAGYYPNTASPAAMQTYEQNKAYILNQFLNGDDRVVTVANSLGIEKPEGVDQYMRIKEIMDYKANAVAQGRLGTTAPLQTAYLDMLSSNGELGKLMDTMTVEARTEAYKDRARAIKEAKSNVRTPSNHGIGGTASTPSSAVGEGFGSILAGQGLTPEEIEFFSRVNNNPTMLQDPDALERFGEIDAKLNL